MRYVAAKSQKLISAGLGRWLWALGWWLALGWLLARGLRSALGGLPGLRPPGERPVRPRRPRPNRARRGASPLPYPAAA